MVVSDGKEEPSVEGEDETDDHSQLQPWPGKQKQHGWLEMELYITTACGIS